jgi:hypothetical protein
MLFYNGVQKQKHCSIGVVLIVNKMTRHRIQCKEGTITTRLKIGRGFMALTGIIILQSLITLPAQDL